MRKAAFGTVVAAMAIAALYCALAAHGRQSVEAVAFDVSDRPLLTLEQQRELATMHRTGVDIYGETVIFEWEGRFPEELKQYMWGMPE